MSVPSYRLPSQRDVFTVIAARNGELSLPEIISQTWKKFGNPGQVSDSSRQVEDEKRYPEDFVSEVIRHCRQGAGTEDPAVDFSVGIRPPLDVSARDRFYVRDAVAVPEEGQVFIALASERLTWEALVAELWAASGNSDMLLSPQEPQIYHRYPSVFYRPAEELVGRMRREGKVRVVNGRYLCP